MSNQLVIGARYGHLTVLKEAPRGKHHERRYICQCDCGNVDSFNAQNITKNPEHRCRKCVPHSGGYKRPDIVGKVINGWEILENNYEQQPIKPQTETVKAQKSMKLDIPAYSFTMLTFDL